MAIFDTGAGGKPNLKFITAGAEQILEGYVGADAKGKPVVGEASASAVVVPTADWDVSWSKTDKTGTIKIPFGKTASGIRCVSGKCYFRSSSNTVLSFDFVVVCEGGIFLESYYSASSGSMSPSFDSESGDITIKFTSAYTLYSTDGFNMTRGFAFMVAM